ncbi:unnamed protein product [Phytomonas sp. EM1]|nr:unnamed protein product [Phytomonas sp. EM1]|eukprot:CCW64278.1 unnamed protein product [Phytomonas sp. isolate EM1]
MSVDPLLMNTVLRGCGCVDASLDTVVRCSPFAIYAIAQQAYYLFYVVATARAMLSSPSSPYTSIVRLTAERKHGVVASSSSDGCFLAEGGLEGLGGLAQRVAILGAGAVAEAYVRLLLGEAPPLVHPTRVTVISAQRPTTNQLRNAFATGMRWSSRAQARPVLASCDFLILACGTVEELLELLKEKDAEVVAPESLKHGPALLKPTTVVFLAVTGAPRTKVAQLLQIDESLVVCADETTPHRAPGIALDYHSKAEECSAQLIKRMSYSLSFLGDAARQAEELRKKSSLTESGDTFSFQPTQWGFTTANTASMLLTLSQQAVPHKNFFAQVWHATLTWVGRLMERSKPFHDEHVTSSDTHPYVSRKETRGSAENKLLGSANSSIQDPIGFEGSMLCAVLSVIPPSSYTAVASAVSRLYQRNVHPSEPNIIRRSQQGIDRASALRFCDSLGVLPLAYNSEMELGNDMRQHYTGVLKKNACRLQTS